MDSILLISEPRLETYKKFTRDTDKAIELHNLTMQVGSSLMAVIALVELALRNSINNQIIHDFGVEEWMRNPPHKIMFKPQDKSLIKTAERHAQKAAYSKLTHKGKKAIDLLIYPHGVPEFETHEELSRKRRTQMSVSAGQVISQTSILFWKRLFSSEYDKALWQPSLKKIFPQKSIKRADVSSQLEIIYSARNRVAHHEPIYGEKLDSTFTAIDYIRKNFGKAKSEDNGPLYTFTEIQFHRLYIDYISFKRSWSLLRD